MVLRFLYAFLFLFSYTNTSYAFDKDSASGWLSVMTKDGFTGYELKKMESVLQDKNQTNERREFNFYGGSIVLFKNHPNDQESGNRSFSYVTSKNGDNFDITLNDVTKRARQIGIGEAKRSSNHYGEVTWYWEWTSQSNYKCRIDLHITVGIFYYYCKKEGLDLNSIYIK